MLAIFRYVNQRLRGGAAKPGGDSVNSVTERGPLAVFAALTLLYAWAAAIDLGFSADGAYFFLRALQDGETLVPERSRVFASLIQLGPVALAARHGVTDLTLLKWLYHVALYLPLPVSWLLCVRSVRRLQAPALLFLPLFSQVVVSLPASSILAGQSMVLAVLVWPVLFLALQPRLDGIDALLLLVLLALMTRVYESAAAPAALLAALLAVRALDREPGQRLLFAAASALALLTPLWSVYSTFADFTGNSQDEFVNALKTPVWSHPWYHPMLTCSWSSLLLLAVAGAGGRVPPAARVWLPRLALLIAALSIAVAAIGRVPVAGVSFNMRTLTFTLLPVLMLLSVAWRLFDWRPSPALARQAGAVLLLLVIGYAVSWNAWRDFRADFRAELQGRHGYVDIERLPLAANVQRWSWTSSVLSVLWSGPCVRTVLWNERNREWPIRIGSEFPLQRYVRYTPELTGAGASSDCAPLSAGAAAAP